MSYIKNIKKDGDNIIIEPYHGNNLKIENNISLDKIDKDSEIVRICFLDLETTGLDAKEDFPIEIAMRIVEFKKTTGDIVNAVAEYESYNDPHVPISSHITKLTGITDEMVSGKSIDWNQVKNLLELSQIAVAHNAKFDRSFIDKYIDTNMVWACSQKDINWMERGFFKISLEMLCMWHGFYFGAHRAMNDVNATINLLTHSSYKENKPMLELINNAKKPIHRIINNFPYSPILVKLIKNRDRRYFYVPNNKSWVIDFSNEDELENERVWLEENIYQGHFRGEIKKLSIFDKYKISL
mgnify:CR=1 FL=1